MYLFGASTLGKKVLKEIEDTSKVKGFIDNFYTDKTFEGLPVYKLEQISLNAEILITSSYISEIIPQLKKGKYTNFKVYSQDILDNFSVKEYWENRYSSGGNSGEGSYNELAMFKATILNDFIEKFNVSNVTEFGCGDGNQLSFFNIKEYVGYDISKTAIKICEEKFKNRKNFFFKYYDGSAISVQNKSELTLSLDVLYHLVEEELYWTYLDNLFYNAGKYVCIYASNFNLHHIVHVKDREFTKDISERYKEWELFKYVENPLKNEDKSDSDFYFYKK